ncbi:capsule polysaccharide biosynthesis protein [Penicillium antarcticum]|uniref:capsule polysaccharide biosynthesis protein n=1 Tax=Penicillium antarcticum TaxID=416450 RepID=UPI0023865186|nr:capsule polysaccharide biosynthesis protein [Penicillium antarcticum]KAJ5297716.1 capsule polysaccharide biosynthesis protein [Penicillium antarcticum]
MSVTLYICAAGAAFAFFGPTFKCIPGMWHARVLYTIITGKILFKKSRYPLFQPDVLTSRAPIFELDIQMHKTNSSYFADLDESRL